VAVVKLLPRLLLGVASPISQPGILRPSLVLAGELLLPRRDCFLLKRGRKQDRPPERPYGRETLSIFLPESKETKMMKKKRSLIFESKRNARQKSSSLAAMSNSPRRADAASQSKSCDRNDISPRLSFEGRTMTKRWISYHQASSPLRGRRRGRVLESRLEPAGI